MIVCVISTEPILLFECGNLDTPFSTYRLGNDIVLNKDVGDNFVCFNIPAEGVTLDGNGFGILSRDVLAAIGVQYTGANVTVQNMHLSGLRVGVSAKGMFGKVEHNVIEKSGTGIEVSSAYNQISNNNIHGLHEDSSAGIYVFFPPLEPVESHIEIMSNIIHDIHGDLFALGISVYYATAVKAMYNYVYDLDGAYSKEIYAVGGEVEIKGNVFSAPDIRAVSVPAADGLPLPSAFLLSCATILVSALWFLPLRSTVKINQGKPQQKEEIQEKKEVLENNQKEESKEQEGEEEEEEMVLEMDGADEVWVSKGKKHQDILLSSA